MPVATAHTFSALSLPESLVKGLSEEDFLIPTPVQQQAIPAVLAGRDLLVQSQTGTGKTLAYAVPLLTKIQRVEKGIQALVLVPTRELALQVCQEIARIGKYLPISTVAIYGGSAFARQVRALRDGASLVVGTPGRICDHIRRGTLMLDTVKTVVLDEGDEMLDMGFQEDLEYILAHLSCDRQTLLFSATILPEIEKIAHKYQKNPSLLAISTGLAVNRDIQHSYYLVKAREKFAHLVTILRYECPERALLFCQTKVETALLAEKLHKEGFQVGFLSGDLSQDERIRTWKRFQRGEITLLVATDVAARGLDIQDISHVIHYTVPQRSETYLHRSGRTARAGQTGQAITLVSPQEQNRFLQMQRRLHIQPARRALPSPQTVMRKQKERWLAELVTLTTNGTTEQFSHLATELLDQIEPVTLVSALLSRVLPDTLKTFSDDVTQGKKKLFQTEQPTQKRQQPTPVRLQAVQASTAERSPTPQPSVLDRRKIYVNRGKSSKMTVEQLRTYLSKKSGIKTEYFGRVDMYNTFSFVEIHERYAQQIINDLHNSREGKKQLIVGFSHAG